MPWTQVREKSWRGAVSEVWVGMGPHSGAPFLECWWLLRNHGISCFNIRILLMKKKEETYCSVRVCTKRRKFAPYASRLLHPGKELWMQQPQHSIDRTQLCTKNPAAEQCSTQGMLTLAQTEDLLTVCILGQRGGVGRLSLLFRIIFYKDGFVAFALTFWRLHCSHSLGSPQILTWYTLA